jgi:hypothetical protein
VGKNRKGLNTAHPDHLREDAGAAGQHIDPGQHIELERLIAYYEGRGTEAERKEVQDHLSSPCVRCTFLLCELNEFSRDSGERGITGPEHLEQEAWEALQRQRSSVRKEPASQTVTAAERRVSWFRSVQRVFTELWRGSSIFELLPHSLPIDASLEPQEHADQDIRPSSVDVGFVEFLKDVEPRLNRLLADYHIPIEDREDIVQQALLALLYQWEKIREPESWLFGTIKRHCLMYKTDRTRSLKRWKILRTKKQKTRLGIDDFLLTMSPHEEEIVRYLRRVARGIVAA